MSSLPFSSPEVLTLRLIPSSLQNQECVSVNECWCLHLLTLHAFRWSLQPIRPIFNRTASALSCMNRVQYLALSGILATDWGTNEKNWWNIAAFTPSLIPCSPRWWGRGDTYSWPIWLEDHTKLMHCQSLWLQIIHFTWENHSYSGFLFFWMM